MNSRSRLLPYKIGLAVLGIVSFAILAVTAAQAGFAHRDENTRKQAEKTAQALNSYVDDKQAIPSSLTAAHIKYDPATFMYRKLSTQRYSFCVNYHAADTGGLTSSVFTALYGYDYQNGANEYGGDYSLAYVEPHHHKGKNCQTVKPTLDSTISSDNSTDSGSAAVITPPYTKNNDGSYTVCGVHTNYFDGEGHVLQGPPTTPGSISISSTGYPYSGARLLFLISAGSQVFNEKCEHLASTDMRVSDTVAVFDITSPSTSATSIFLKRSY